MLEKLNLYRRKLFSNTKVVVILIILLILITTSIGISKAHKTITINVDNETLDISTFKKTVQQVLDENSIALIEKDKIKPSLESVINEDTVIEIKKAIDVIVKVDGEELFIKSAEKNIEKMLLAEGITLNDMDRVEPDKATDLAKDLDIKITRVKEDIIVEKFPVEYETVVKEDATLDSSIQKVTQEGSPGEKEIKSKVILEDGQEVERKIVEEKIVKEPIEELIVKGTMNTLVLSRGENIPYKKKMNMEATAYAGDTITATGTVPKRNTEGLSTIAVDPRVIPLGTKVYVEGYGYAIAEDTGGAIKNNIIDIFLNSSAECYSWGRRMVNVYILEYPGE
ncbi:MAG: 3D domain-containing protein [Sarcina sp.]